MSSQQIIQDAVALPLAERFHLAQELWQSLDAGIRDTDASSALSEAILRDEELTAGRVAARSHQDVMVAARRAIRCGFPAFRFSSW